MPFAEELPTRSSDETLQRTSVDYVKFNENHRTTLRMLQTSARMVWKHYIPQANKGKGLSAVCPNSQENQFSACPIEKSGRGFPKDSQEYKDSRARRRYIVNVLDRTPYATCPACNNVTPKVSGNKCLSCRADVSKVDFLPLNKVKLLEGGPNLFTGVINPIEKMQDEELGKDVTEYDIVFTAQGTGRDRKVSGLPRNPEPLNQDWLNDENGEPQRLYDLDALIEPTPIEQIELMMQGVSADEIYASTRPVGAMPF